MERRKLTRLEELPNVGPAIALKLRRLGIGAPGAWIGLDPYALYERLNTLDGERHDPCLLDVFISVARYLEGAPPRPWWSYTAERKRVLAQGAEPSAAPPAGGARPRWGSSARGLPGKAKG